MVIVNAGLGPDFDDGQRLVAQKADGGFATADFFFHQNLRIVAQHFRQSLAPIGDSLNELKAEAGTLADWFEHDRRIPTHGPTGCGRINQHEAGGRNTSRYTALLGQELIEPDAAGLGIAPGVRHTQFLESKLHGAIFAVGPVKGQEYELRAFGQLPVGVLRVHFVYRVAERAQCFGHLRAGAQGDFAFGAWSAEQDGNVKLSRHWRSRRGAEWFQRRKAPLLCAPVGGSQV